MVRIHPDPPLSCLGVLTDQLCMAGGLAQLGEHLLCKQGVVGSIPSSSTITTHTFFVADASRRLAACASDSKESAVVL